MIAFRELGFAPLFARDDIAVQFYGYAILLHAELLDEQSQSDRGKIAFLAIDCQFHLCSIFATNRYWSKHGSGMRIAGPFSPVGRRLTLSLHFFQLELAGGGATGMTCLHQHRRIRQGSLIHFRSEEHTSEL